MPRIAWLLVMSTLVLLPLLWCLITGADAINVANESVAYRFFYSVRLHSGSDGTAWLPQGQLISSVQHVITWLLPVLSFDNLRSSLNKFFLLSLAFVSAISVAALTITGIVKKFNWNDRISLSVVALAPIYVLPSSYTWLWPDYLALNIALSVFCVLLFQLEWRHIGDRPLVRVALYGAFVGSLAANKVTMVLVALPLLLVALTTDATLVSFGRRGMICAISAAFTFCFWLLAASQFDLNWLHKILPLWWNFLKHPGVEPGFNIIDYLSKGYWVAMFWLIAAFCVALISFRDRRALIVIYASALAALVCIVALIKRPASTTAADDAVIFLALGAMLFATCEVNVLTRSVLAITTAAQLLTAVATRPFRVMETLGTSRRNADVQWSFFSHVRQEAHGTVINYFIPDNYYQHGDVFTLLLKGASDFTTWKVTENGDAILARLGVSINFVSEYVYPNGWVGKITPGSMAVWINAPYLAPVEKHYPILRNLREGSGTRTEIFNLGSPGTLWLSPMNTPSTESQTGYIVIAP